MQDTNILKQLDMVLSLSSLIHCRIIKNHIIKNDDMTAYLTFIKLPIRMVLTSSMGSMSSMVS